MDQKREIILQDGTYSIERIQGIPPEVQNFLDGMNWGSAGAVYEHKNTPEHIQNIPDPVLIALKDENEILGTAVFCHTRIFNKGLPFNCYYVRYFAASPSVKGKGILKQYAVEVMRGIRNSEKEKTIYFASVEAGNKASDAVVSRAGYVPMAQVKTLGFSRFYPQLNAEVQNIENSVEKEQVLSLLKSFYQNHALVRFDSLFLSGQYLVIREKGEIVAGCQYHRAHWVVKQMPGLQGKLITRILPHFPFIRRLFNPAKFEFLGFEGIYFQPGKEHRLQALFEHALAREKLNSAMFWMDEKCPYYQKLCKTLRKGLLHSFVKNSGVKIMGSWSHLSHVEFEELINGPVYISSYDHL